MDYFIFLVKKDYVNKMKIKLSNGGKIPTKKHNTDAGFDIYSPISFSVEGHSCSMRIDLGVGFEIPYGYVGRIEERSSQGAKGISTKGNIIDCGYTGNAHVTLSNNSDETYYVDAGDRICQLVIYQILPDTDLEIVEEFEQTDRGSNAHGSTGK